MKRFSLTPSFKQGLKLSFIFLLLSFIFLEIGIRSYDVLKGRGFFSSHRNRISNMKPVFPFRTFGFKLYEERDGIRYISSVHGELYPLEKKESTFRIVCFGGSTTESIMEGVHYPLVLQSILRERLKKDVEVINVGYPAYATPHSLILLELDVLFWKPDLVIIGHNVNDLTTGYWSDFTFDYSNRYSNRFYLPDHRSRFTLINLIFQHSQLYWFGKYRIGELRNIVMRSRVKLRRKSYGDKPKSVAMKVFELNLRSFVTLAASNGIQVLLTTQPLQPSEEYFFRHMGYKPYNDRVTYPFHEEFVRHHSSYNEIIKHVAMDTGVSFIDNNKIMEGRKEYFVDFVHYSKRGLEKLGRNYADFIIANGIIGEAK